MKSVTMLSIALGLFAGELLVANAQTSDGLVMNTPMQLVTCQNASLSWTGAPAGPVFVSVVPGGQPAAAPLVQFNSTDSSQGSLVWLVDLPAETAVTVLITDMTGKSTGSAEVTIKKGVDTLYVGKGQSAHPGSTAGEPSTSSGSTTSSSTNTTTTAPSSSSTTSAATKPVTSSTTSSTTPSTDSSTQTSTSSTKPATNTSPSTSSTVVSTPAKTQADGVIALQSQLSVVLAAVLLSALFMVF